MKLGFFASQLPYGPGYNPRSYFCGGSAIALHSLIVELAKRKHAIDVFTTAADGKDRHETHANLAIHRYGTAFHFLNANVSSALFYKPLNYDVDLVTVSFDIPPNTLAGYVYALKKHVPLVLYHHGDFIANYGSFVRRSSVSLFNSLFVDKMLSYATVIISPSLSYIDVSDTLSKYRDKIRVIPNGINRDDFAISRTQDECKAALGLGDDIQVILYLGDLSSPKGPDVLLRALPRIVDTVPHALLLFAGDGPLRSHLGDLARKLGVEGNVRFDGFVPHAETRLYYAASDVFVLPSKKDMYGLVAAEALMCGTPTIITRCCGIVDLVNETRCGYVVREDDISELADTVVYVLQNRIEAREKARRGKHYLADTLSWQNIAEQFEDVYRSLAEA